MTNASQFISQVVPATMLAGHEYDVTVQLKNTGTTTWARLQKYRLGSQSPQDNLTWGIGRIELPADIPPGGTVTFNFRVKAPATAGAHNFQWRMVQENVEWFGALTTNVAIQVSRSDTVEGNGAQFVAQSVPARMLSGASFSVSVQMKNVGTTEWTRDLGYRLGPQHPQDNVTWGLGRVELAPGEVVKPGQSKTFQFSARAPATPGTYHFQWKMLREGVEWFGELSPDVAVTVEGSGSVVTHYHVIACGYPRYGSDQRADDINVRQPEFGYWKYENGQNRWYAKSQRTREYGERTKRLLLDAGIEILTGFADVNDRVSLDNTLVAFGEVDLRPTPLRLAVMFGTIQFGGSPDSKDFLKQQMGAWARMARDRGRYAYVADAHGAQRPLVMIWGPINRGAEAAFGAFLKNEVRRQFMLETGATPFIVMTQHVIPPAPGPHPLDAVLVQLDGVYQHECAIPPKGTTWTTEQAIPPTEAAFTTNLKILEGRRNEAGDPILFFPGTMIQFNRDRVRGDDHGHVEASGPDEASGRAQAEKMLNLVKRYAPTVYTESTGSGYVHHKWVTVTSLSEWPEGQTLEPSTVRGRKYLPGTSDYGHDFLDLIGAVFSGRPRPSFASIVGKWDKTSTSGPHYILTIVADTHYTAVDPASGTTIEKGIMPNYTSTRFYVLRDGELETREFLYSLSPDGNTLTTDNQKGLVQTYKRIG